MHKFEVHVGHVVPEVWLEAHILYRFGGKLLGKVHLRSSSTQVDLHHQRTQ